MTKSKRYQIQRYKEWSENIFAAIEDFIEEFEETPQVIMVSSHTAKKIDVAMSTELIAEGKTDKFEQIGVYACPLAELPFFIDDQLEERDFLLAHDDEAKRLDEAEEEEDVLTLLKKHSA